MTGRDFALGLAFSVVLVFGYALFPDGTLFEWAGVGISFLVGVVWALMSDRLAGWRELGSMTFGAALLAVVGVGSRMWLNDFAFVDTVLLVREQKYVWS